MNKALRYELHMSDLRHDPWGTVMGYRFAMNDILTDLGGTTATDFRQALAGSDVTAYEYQTLLRFVYDGLITLEEIEHAERVLDRYCDILRVAGRDY